MSVYFSKKLNETKEKWRHLSDMDKVIKVNSMINFVKYKKDKKDTWLTPSEFLSSGGDCEDFAICKYYLLLDIGISKESLKISYSRLFKNGKKIPHMVLLYEDNYETYILDNTTMMLWHPEERKDLTLSWKFDDEYLSYKHVKRKNTMKKWLAMKSRLKLASDV